MGLLSNTKKRIRRKYFPNMEDKQFAAYEQWVADNAEQTLRYNYPLTKDSVVFDCGGYHGDFAFEISSRYDCNVFVFEPVIEYYNGIVERFSSNDKVRAYPIGISDRNYECPIYLSDDGSSQFAMKGKPSQVMHMVDIVSFLSENNITHVDLIKINIEGGEYALLERILDSGKIDAFSDIQVQFHKLDEKGYGMQRMADIQKRLSETHELTYQYYPWIWENWNLKKCN